MSTFYNAREYGKAITIQEEGVDLVGSVGTINFVGSGVTTSAVGDVVTVNIAEGFDTKQITQNTHGFVVGDWLYIDTGTNIYTKAIATSSAAAEVVGVVNKVIDANTFTILTDGYFVNGSLPGSTGDVLFLSETVAGALQSTAPVTVGNINKPVGVRTSDGLITINMRGEIQ